MNEEYEVEYITQARVEKKRGRGKNLVWKFCVRWKGYGVNDDTWEPAESFEGSEDIINHFWGRANLGGRDHHDMSLFKAGEEFLPTGPPRRKERRKSPEPEALATPTLSLSQTPQKAIEGKRTFQEHSGSILDGSEDDRPRKRIRSHSQHHAQRTASPPNEVERIPLPRHARNAPGHDSIDQAHSPPTLSRRQQRKDFRSSSMDEIIPASDDEVDRTFTSHPQHVLTSPIASGSSVVYPGDGDPLFGTFEDELVTLPSHRARAANPLVKMVENPSIAGLDGAISVKTRLAGGNSVKSPEKSRKPGPGRSSSGLIKNSLLTFQKGSLKTVKGSYKRQTDKPGSEELVHDGHNGESMGEGGSNNGNIQAPPTANELLGLAGLDTQNAEILSDFEEDVPITAQILEPDRHPLPPSLPAPQPDAAQLAQQRSLASLALTKDKLLPSVAITSQMNTPNTTWKRSTIFDALGLGLDASATSDAVTSKASRSSPFCLNLDSTVSIPVVLTHPLSSIETIVGKRGPPGKFYDQQAAMALLDTLRTGGPSGKVVTDANSTELQRMHFDRFCSRLNAGELFVAIAGMDVLAFCSTDNVLISQRLNIPPSLLGQPGEVLVSQVIIENHSAYADAAVNADGREWSRYLLAFA